MRNEFFANIEAGAAAVRSFACSSADRLARQLASDPAQESQNQLPCPENRLSLRSAFPVRCWRTSAAMWAATPPRPAA